MDENKINEVYDNLIKVTDGITDGTITGEEATKKMEEVQAGIKEISEVPVIEQPDIPDLDVVPETIDSEKIMVKYNPLTGDIADDSSVSIEDVVDKNWESFIRGASSDVTSDIVKDVINSGNFNGDDDATKLAILMTKRMSGEEFNYYEELPDAMKAKVDEMLMQIRLSGNFPKGAPINRRYLAKMLLDECIEDYKKDASSQMDLDTMLSGFNGEIEKAQNEMSTELGGMMMSFDEERIAEIDAAIKRCEEAGNVEAVHNLEAIKSTITSAFNLKDFIEFCKTCKVKTIEIEKPSRMFDYFNSKYEHHKNTINDIRSCPTILSRHLTEYTQFQLIALCVAFCKFCQYMSPDNMGEHTFMYYFIRNIIAIDRLNPKGNLYMAMDDKSKAFYDDFTTNLKAALNNLIEKNAARLGV